MTKSKTRNSARYGRAEPLLLPPNLQTTSALTFTAIDFVGFDAWLAEDGWPEERMDAAAIEGYLMALLVWPIDLAPGAWLPGLWGVKGWKVAAKIATPAAYDRFIALAIGFLQELERRLSLSPQGDSLVLPYDVLITSTKYFAGAAWATGFMTALFQHSSGLQSRSVAARSAVEKIASYAALRSAAPQTLRTVSLQLTAAITVLLAERVSRGPLGPTGRSDAKILRRRTTVALGVTADVVAGVEIADQGRVQGGGRLFTTAT
jgi:yecA family protein